MDQALLENKKVLVVEDDLINQFIVKHLLGELGAIFEVAVTGVEAVEKFQLTKFDLVLLDIQLPLMDGYEVTKYIRNQLKSNIPIIAMTAFALKGESEKCLELGMNDCVPKPFTIESLSSCIKNVLQLQEPAHSNPYILSNGKVAVDVSMLYDIAGDDNEYIQLMISTFLENLPATFKKMEEALSANDYDALYKAAHYAKSSLSIIKIDDAHDTVAKIERSAKLKTDLNNLPLLLQQVKEKLEAAEQVLTAKFGSTVRHNMRA